MLDVDVLKRSKHFVLLFTDGTGFEGGGRFHRHERQDLEKMRDHHVPVGPRGVVERAPFIDRQRLGNIDLYVLDVVPIPDRLEQSVGEAKRQDVLGGFFAEEVIDSEDLIFREDLVHRRVEQLGAFEIGAKRLLHDDAGTLDQIGFGQHLHHRTCRTRGNAQVVQASRRAGQALLRLVPRLLARPPGARPLGDVGQSLGEVGPVRVHHAVAGRTGCRTWTRNRRNCCSSKILERRPDDAKVREQAGSGEMEDAGQQLSFRKIARRSEEHQYVRRECGNGGRAGVGGGV